MQRPAPRRVPYPARQAPPRTVRARILAVRKKRAASPRNRARGATRIASLENARAPDARSAVTLAGLWVARGARRAAARHRRGAWRSCRLAPAAAGVEPALAVAMTATHSTVL